MTTYYSEKGNKSYKESHDREAREEVSIFPSGKVMFYKSD